MSDNPLENPELVEEYLTSLQDQIDGLRARNLRLEARVSRLKAERDHMTARVPRRHRRELGSKARPSPSPPKDPTIVIPGVGEIGDVQLPDGPVARPNLVVGAVVDDFSRSAFRYEFDLRDVPATNPEEALEEIDPEFVLVESAYGGVDGSWAGRIARFGRPSTELRRLVDWCKDHGVPTVFWVK